MRNGLFLLIVVLFLSVKAFGQNQSTHYIKIFHIGERVIPVHTLNISYQDGDIPVDTDEAVLDTLPAKTIITDEETYQTIFNYIKSANFSFGKHPAVLSFGTFKIIEEGKYYYLPDYSCTAFFKNLVAYLKRKKSDPQAIQSIIDNYPWVFNP